MKVHDFNHTTFVECLRSMSPSAPRMTEDIHS